jgi:hypothetical protein
VNRTKADSLKKEKRRRILRRLVGNQNFYDYIADARRRRCSLRRRRCASERLRLRRTLGFS